ncbi:MAG: hypothetical protein QCI00_04685, partial [Candidatus Thermoplasmatota archaeon]|nr:hypothetical protein [Candidatus Thermoplasmatota archaeon]
AKSNQNVYLDLSYFGNLAFGTNLFHDFCLLLDKLDQKVIFGTDFPEVNIDEYTNLWRKKLNHLSQDKIHRIFAGNAKQVFNI